MFCLFIDDLSKVEAESCLHLLLNEPNEAESCLHLLLNGEDEFFWIWFCCCLRTDGDDDENGWILV